MREKLKDSRGETLVEVLASVLVCALSITLLMGAVSASANIDLQAQEADKAYYEALTKAERQDEKLMTLSVVVASANSGPKTEPPLICASYGSERLLSYAIDPPAEEAPGTGGGG